MMDRFLIQLEAMGRTYEEEIKAICAKHSCEVSKITQNGDRVFYDITTNDPVNFFRLGRRWISFDNIIAVK